ncbi:unnamed protein product [Somion occarium]|uniref:Protein kinase domain-containing protein n=1 Tax=Somion occarium TaxID=3059160 RepID=A0ABP1CEV0_9APHY
MPTQAVDVPFTSELFYQLSSIEMYGQEKPVLVLSIDEAYMKDLRADDHPIKGSTDNCTIYKAKLLERDAIINGTANPLTVAVKWARGDSGLERLRWEHLLYSNNLSNIQGLFVPKCYGLFASQSEGVTISCLVLDWCQKAPGADSIMMDLTEYNVKALAAVRYVHSCGVLLGNMRQSNFMLSANSEIHIISFSRAEHHTCLGEGHCAQLQQVDRIFRPRPGKWQPDFSAPYR